MCADTGSKALFAGARAGASVADTNQIFLPDPNINRNTYFPDTVVKKKYRYSMTDQRFKREKRHAFTVETFLCPTVYTKCL
jgi:hypothetical protein